jgi:hypothetical protein
MKKLIGLCALQLLAGCAQDEGGPTAPGGFADFNRQNADTTVALMDTLSAEPDAAIDSGFRGVVYEKQSDGGEMGPIAGASILFIPERGHCVFRTRSDAQGRYAIRLRPGRYYVRAQHPQYEPFTTCAGFYVVGQGAWRVGNIDMWRLGTCRCLADGTFGAASRFDPAGQSDQPPVVTLSLSQTEAQVGETIQVTVSGLDDAGLCAIWWGSALGCLPRTCESLWFSCGGEFAAAHTWSVVFTEPGRYVLFANARDVAYPRLGEAHQASEGTGMGCAELIVCE